MSNSSASAIISAIARMSASKGLEGIFTFSSSMVSTILSVLSNVVGRNMGTGTWNHESQLNAKKHGTGSGDGQWQLGAGLVSVLGGALTGMGIDKGTGTFWQYRCIGTGTKMGTGMGSTSTWGFHSSAGRKGSRQSPRYAAPI